MTLKVSTIEQSAEQVDARGGWGNPKLITWDYGKEISLALTDALISPESLAFMMGGNMKDAAVEGNLIEVYRSAEGVINASKMFSSLYDGASKMTYKANADTLGKVKNNSIKWVNLTQGTRGQITFTDSAAPFTFSELNTEIAELEFAQDDKVRVFWVEERSADASGASDDAFEITINASTFPGTYKVVGDTFIRSANTGADSAFQFVIPKAKVSSNVTISLEAEGDPSTFEMTLTVLRAGDGEEMMKLIKY